jgi:hypothetical protein
LKNDRQKIRPLETYRLEDAEIAVGSYEFGSRHHKDIIDQYRDKGVKPAS